MIAALIFLKESNPLIVDEEGNPRKVKLESTLISIILRLEKEQKQKQKRNRPHVTLLMVMCFVSEFCIRWTVNAFDSRYGIYVTDKFNASSAAFSYLLLFHYHYRTLIVLQSIWTALQQTFIYPWLVSTVNVPIPWMGIIGYIIVFISYFGMVLTKTMVPSMIYSSILWVGFSLVSPSSVSIISVFKNNRDYV